MQLPPLLILALGIASVIGLILALRLNAFLALIISAILISLLSPGDTGSKIGRVATEFGVTAGNIGVVIALASIIGTCMMDSGAADRIVRAFLSWLGEKRAAFAMLGSGYVLAVPVFFDTVFYLLVPLARSLYRRTGRNYLVYIVAIGAGGAATHTLVPPTPGPLLIASILGVDLGLMILVGAAVALPASLAGLAYGAWINRRMDVPVRPVVGMDEPRTLDDHELPPLGLSLLPVLLPVLLISANTAVSTWADAERAARVRSADLLDAPAIVRTLTRDDLPADAPEVKLQALLTADDRAALQAAIDNGTDPAPTLAEILNRDVLPQRAASRALSSVDLSRKTGAIVEHENRLALEAIFPESVLARHEWETSRRKTAEVTALLGDPNLALLASAVVAMLLYVRQIRPSRDQLSRMVEQSLMSGGVIILITAAGGAFGAMLKAAQVGPAIEGLFRDSGASAASGGLGLLMLGFLISAVLKIAQGSSTVAMITASGMMATLIPSADVLGFHPVYIATAIGSGSLIISWMNDSGFWVVAKMSGLTEAETLKTWTPALLALGVTGLLFSVFLSQVLPLV